MRAEDVHVRIPRYFLPGGVHHIIARFVDRGFILDEPGARARYLELLGRSLRTSDWRCFGYALMSSHSHLTVVAGDEEPEHWLKRVHSPFGVWINQQRNGLGPIIAQRPSFRIVPDGDVAKVLAYVHNNPVRAGVVAAASDSAWTSHRAYLGREKAPEWLRVDDGFRLCNIDRPDFDAWVRAQVGAEDEVRAADLLQRRALRAFHRRGIVASTVTLGANPEVALVRRREGLVRPAIQDVIAVVAFVLRLPAETVMQRGASRIRRYVLEVGKKFGLTVSELSAAMGITRQRGDAILRTGEPPDEALIEQATLDVARGLPVDKVATVPTQQRGRIAGRKRAR